MIDVLYFASLRETLDCDREELDLGAYPGDVAQLKARLVSRGGIWQEVFARQNDLLVSVNHEMANDGTPLNEGDEIAFFPPVTGG